jgi:hypothetical protein
MVTPMRWSVIFALIHERRMFKKYLTPFAEGAFWFVFGFMVMAVPLTVICAIGALSGRYLETVTWSGKRPTSKWFYENLVAHGHYKTLAVYLGSISLAGGIIFVMLFALSKRTKKSDDDGCPPGQLPDKSGKWPIF